MFKRFKVTGINENPKKPKRNFMKYLALGCVMALPAFALLKTGVLSMNKNVLAADKNKYDIVADLDGGKFEMGTTPEFTKMDNGNWLYKYKPVPTPTKLPAPVKDGYDFIGWTVGSDSAVKPEYSIPAWHKGNLNVKANWKSKDAILMSGSTFNSTIKQIPGFANVTEIRFVKGTPNQSGVSVAAEGDIKAHVSGNILTIASEKEIFANPDSSTMFEDFGASYGANKLLDTILFNNFNTSKVNSMSSMFRECQRLTSLDLNSFNTSNVTSMYSMFRGCDVLTSLNISHFDTSKVTNMEGMFYQCSQLPNLDVTSFDTKNVTNMYYMFRECGKLQSVDVSGFNTSKVTNMHGMFYWCGEISEIKGIENFNTSKVNNMGFMFDDCYNLQKINVSNWNISNVANMREMFSQCHKLNGSITIANPNLTRYSATFSGCSTDPNAKFYVKFKDDATKEIARKMVATKSSNSNVFLYETSKLVNGKEINRLLNLYAGWEVGYPLSELRFRFGDVPVDAENITDVSEAKDGSIKLYTLTSRRNLNEKGLPPHNNIYITSNKIIQFNEDCSGMFENVGLSAVVFSNIGKSNIKSMENMFKNSYICNSNLEVLDLSSVTNMNNMFNGSHAITDYITINNPNITSYTDMFKGCSTDPYAKFIVKYTSPETRKVAEKMVATKSPNSHVYLDGTQPVELVSGRDFNTKISAMPDFGSVTEIRFIKGKPNSDGVDVGIYPDEIKASINGNVLTVASEYEIFANPDCSSMFISYTPPHDGGTNRMLPHANLTSIEFNNFNTSNVTDMHGMFTNCISLTSLDLHNFNTSNVTDMGGMFNSCARLEKINVSGWDTSKVTNMSCMFDTTNATYPRSNIKQIIGLDNFDTSSVTKMDRMLYGCRYLSGEITISNSNISMYDQMFEECSTDPNAKFIVRYTSPATKEVARKMVATKSSNSNVELYSVPSTLVDGQTFNNKFNSVPDFQKATEIRFLRGTPNMSGVDLSEAQDKSIMGAFNGTVFEVVCDGKMYANPDCSSMFYNIGVSDDDSTLSYNVKTIRFDNFDTSKVTNMSQMFDIFRAMSRSQITNLYGIENWDVSKVTNMSYMFEDRDSIVNLDLSKWNADSLIEVAHMFNNCSNLKSLNVSNFNVSRVKIFSWMFMNCSSLTNLDLSKWRFGKDIDSMTYMFSGCKNLSGNLFINSGSSFNDYSFMEMFDGCSTASGSKFTVKYEDETVKSFAEQMVATKSSNSNVILYELPKPAILMSGSKFNEKIMPYLSYSGEDPSEKKYVIFEKGDLSNLPSDAIDVSEAQDGSVMMYFNTRRYRSPITMPFGDKEIHIVSDKLIEFNEDCSYMFSLENKPGYRISSIEFNNIDTSKVRDMRYMFSSCDSLISLDLSSFNTSSVYYVIGMFRECSSLTNITGLKDFDMSNIENMIGMFDGCINLNGEITISNPNMIFYNDVFANCSTNSPSKFIVNYKSGCYDIASSMINGGEVIGNVVLGTEVFEPQHSGGANRDIPNKEEPGTPMLTSTKPAPTSYAAVHQNTKPVAITQQVTITLNNGPMAMYPVQKIQVNSGKIGDLAKPDLNPKYAGQFGGYFYDKNCTIPVKPNDVVTQDIELYAKW